MKKYCGWMIFGTLILFLLSWLTPYCRDLAAVFAWAVLFIMWSDLSKNGRTQVLLLTIPGLCAILFSAYNGVFLGWRQLLSANLPLLAMFAAVSFLTLTNKASEDDDLPRNKSAALTTAIGAHLLGSVINLSVLFVFGDRLKKNGILAPEQRIILARSFCAAAWWSPFFIATGVAFTYAPEMQWSETLVPGAIMATIAICYTVTEVIFIRKALFAGYPTKVESLRVPVLLALAVIGVHYVWPDISILLLICVLSPIGALLFMKGRPRIPVLHDYIQNKITSMTSQFALFLAAGVFSTGIMSIVATYPAIFNLDGYSLTTPLFALILALMISAGFFGVHPVVTVAIVSPLILPLEPNHSQLGFLFLSSWAISTGSSPLSGVGLALISRYHASPREIVSNNYLYAIVMWFVSVGVNVLFFG